MFYTQYEKKNIKDFIFKTLKKANPISKNELKNIDNFNFIESGHLDSIQILKFNLQIEKKFKIILNPKETTSKKYMTVKGIVSIIEKKLNK